MLGSAQLLAIMPYARDRMPVYLDWLNFAIREFNIYTPLRQAHFFAQIAHESGELRYVEEIASGEAYDTGALAERLGNTPEADGDGPKWKGRGLIQITGLYNYRKVYEHFRIEQKWEATEDVVGWLQTPEGASRSAGWYWWDRDLNALADFDELEAITLAINGGLNGLASRDRYLRRAKVALGLATKE